MEQSQKTIYIVDDDEDDVFIIREAIADLKIAVRIYYASNGRELLNMLDENVEDALILVDMNMPLLNGVETLRAIYSNPDLRHLRSILISTSNSSALEKLALEAGALKFINKPHTFGGYVQLLKDISNNYF